MDHSQALRLSLSTELEVMRGFARHPYPRLTFIVAVILLKGVTIYQCLMDCEMWPAARRCETYLCQRKKFAWYPS